jgi:hypothetical protein
VFALVILGEVYINKILGGGAAGSLANCKLQIANWLRHFLQPLIFFFLFLSRKKEKRLISSDLHEGRGKGQSQAKRPLAVDGP